jgi:hypothetical protein
MQMTTDAIEMALLADAAGSFRSFVAALSFKQAQRFLGKKLFMIGSR